MPSIYQVAAPYFKEVGVTFRTQYLSATDSTCFNDQYSGQVPQINCLLRATAKRGLQVKRKKILTYYFVNRWYNDGAKYFGGFAIDVCGTVAMGSADHDWYYGEGNYTQAAGLILAHEVLHLMCASHTPEAMGESIMSTHLWSWWDKPQIRVLNITKRQVKRWYVKERING